MVGKFSLSQSLLAAAIAYLAFSLTEVANEAANVVTLIDELRPQVKDITQEVGLVRQEVALVRALVKQQTPDVLAQFEAALPLANKALEESEKYSRQLPSLLNHIEQITTQINSIEKQIPSMLSRADAAVFATNKLTNEAASWRPHSKKYLEEAKLSREYIPRYLTRVEQIATEAKTIVREAKTIGKEASSGFVSGLFKGVITLPLEVVAGLNDIVDSNSKSAKILTAQDITLIQEQAVLLLDSAERSKGVWQNVTSGNRGMIVKEAEIERKNQRCHYLVFTNVFPEQKETLKELMCKNSKGIWQVI